MDNIHASYKKHLLSHSRSSAQVLWIQYVSQVSNIVPTERATHQICHNSTATLTVYIDVSSTVELVEKNNTHVKNHVSEQDSFTFPNHTVKENTLRPILRGDLVKTCPRPVLMSLVIHEHLSILWETNKSVSRADVLLTVG